METVERQLETAKVEAPKPFAQEADAPTERVSLKERLAEMKIKAAGNNVKKKKTEKIKSLTATNNGMIRTSQVTDTGISKTVLYQYIIVFLPFQKSVPD